MLIEKLTNTLIFRAVMFFFFFFLIELDNVLLFVSFVIHDSVGPIFLYAVY